MPPEDYKSPLQSASGVATVTPTSGTATVGGYTNPLIEQRRQLGPKLAEAAQSYPGALQAAREAQMKAYDNASGIRGEEIGRLSKPGQNQMWGRFGASLLAPTSTGSFFEGFGRAANAAMDERDRYNDKEAERLDKLTRSRLALEELHANRPNAQIGAIEDSMKAYEFAGKTAGILADDELGNGPTPTGDEALLADYAKNPNKYIGVGGRQMVADARARVSAAAKQQDERAWWTQQQEIQSALRQQEEEAKANRPKDLTNLDKKTYLEAQRQNTAFIDGLRNLKRAQELGPKTYHGLIPGTRAWIKTNTGIGFNEAEEASAHIEYQNIMQGEAIKQMAETLKGATTDYEMRKFIDMIADPTLPWEDKEPAVTRIMQFLETQSAMNSDVMRSIDPTGQLFGGDPMSRKEQMGAAEAARMASEKAGFDVTKISPEDREWVQRQIDRGVPEEDIFEALRGDYAGNN